MKTRSKKFRKNTLSVGSALILAVVLTSLLAIVGVLFVMTARVDKIATSAISEHRELDLAIDAVIARISQELVLDVPDPCRLGEEYYDYPDDRNAWLASLEPFESDRWLHISDLYYMFGHQPFAPIADLDADADGDGVSDSIWVELPNITSGKGRTIYAAVRVIDNGAMLNVNTAHKFDPTEGLQRIDGSSQMQINLAGLSLRGANGTLAQAADKLHDERCGAEPNDLSLYQPNVVWRYGNPDGLYTPFDISDELELRNRFLINQPSIDTRIEEVWYNAFQVGKRVPFDSDIPDWFIRAADADANTYSYRHIGTTCNMDRIIAPDGRRMVNVNIVGEGRAVLMYEVIRAGLIVAGVTDPNRPAAQMAVNIADYRDDNSDVNTIMVDGQAYYGFERPCIYISELAYNFASVNDVNHMSYAIELYKPYFEDDDPVGWQLVIDNPPRVVDVNWSGTRRFHVVLFEDRLASLRSVVNWTKENTRNPADGATWVDPRLLFGWPGNVEAKEYNLYLGSSFDDVKNADKDANECIAKQLIDNNYPIIGYDPNGLEPETTYYWRVDGVNIIHPDSPWKGDVWRFTTGPNDFDDPNFQTPVGWSPGTAVFAGGSIIELRRLAENGVPVVVDSIQVPDWLVTGGLRSFQRDITLHKCIRRLWPLSENTPTLGHSNIFRDQTDPNIMIQAHPYLDPAVYDRDPAVYGTEGFRNIGEIGKVFRGNAYTPQLEVYPPDIIGYNGEIEGDVRINLADPNFQQIFNYLTVFDPTADGINNDGDVNSNLIEIIDEDDELTETPEWKIPGRININTAPWYVIAQLPWMTPEIAQAIVYYRHTPQGPFESIGELNNVVGMDLYATDGERNGFPDLTPEDGAVDDFEERDLLFARISNLVTVRSDVFTAYVLVRIGPDGPQKRVIAILDRSDVYADGTGRVRVRALHPVPDPR